MQKPTMISFISLVRSLFSRKIRERDFCCWCDNKVYGCSCYVDTGP